MRGLHVAINRSGRVETGTIQHITPGGVVQVLRDPEFRQEPTSWNQNPNHVSEIKGTGGVLVIHEGSYAENAKIRQQQHERLEEAHKAELEEVRKKTERGNKKAKSDLTALIACIRKAWDVEEIQDYVIEHFGPEHLEKEEKIPEWLQTVRDDVDFQDRNAN
jgi:hypothetical protein